MSRASRRALPARSRRSSAALGLLLAVSPCVAAVPAHAQPAADAGRTGLGAAAGQVVEVGAASQTAAKRSRADRGLAKGVDNWWFEAMGLAKIQRRTIGEGVQVAILDGGIWTQAPDLAGIDLTVHRSCTPSPVTDNARRGSHGAGMVAALAGQGTRGDGRPGLRGVAPGVSVHYYGGRDTAAISRKDCRAKWIIAAVDDGADIITSSTRWYVDDRAMDRALRYAADAGVVVVKSAGNAGQDRDMREDGVKPGVVLVTAVNRDGIPQGNVPPVLSTVDPVWNAVAAPGWEATGSGWVPGQGWVSGAEFNGTSYATPVVAGQLALQKSVYPDATGNQLIQSLIHDTANTDWEWLRGYGFGIAAISAMIKRDPAGWPDVNPLVDKLPRQVLRRYPREIYGADETAAADDPEPSSEAAADSTPSAAPTPTPTAGPGAAGTSSSESAQAAADSGAPGWIWPLAALSIAVLVGLGSLLLRRRTTTTTAGKD